MCGTDCVVFVRNIDSVAMYFLNVANILVLHRVFSKKQLCPFIHVLCNTPCYEAKLTINTTSKIAELRDPIFPKFFAVLASHVTQLAFLGPGDHERTLFHANAVGIA